MTLPPLAGKLLWFAVLWAAGVAGLGIAAFLIRRVMFG